MIPFTPKEKDQLRHAKFRDFKLIQRLQIQQHPHLRSWVGRVVDHEYMGYAEFVFEAITKSWETFRDISNLTKGSVHVGGITFHYICHKDYTDDDVALIIRGLATNSIRTKGHTNISTLFTSRRDRVLTKAWVRVSEQPSLPFFFTIDAQLQNNLSTLLGLPQEEFIHLLTLITAKFDPIPSTIKAKEKQNVVLHTPDGKIEGEAVYLYGKPEDITDYIKANGGAWVSTNQNIGWEFVQ